MSLSSKAIMAGLKLFSVLNPSDADVHRIWEKAQKHNAKQSFATPKDNQFVYRAQTITTDKGAYPLLRMKKHKSAPDKAILYIPGGGAVYDCCQGQLPLARAFLKQADGEVFYPFYPPTTTCSIRESYAMLFECYKAVLREYPAEKVSIIGVSSGGTAALSLIAWNNYFKLHIDMPALVVALSPGHVPADDREREMLNRYRGIDPMIPVDLVEAYGEINRGKEDLPHWMIHSAHGDFSNAKKIRIYWGEKESLVYAAPIYEESLKNAHVDYTIHIEPGMPHTYACMRVNKACRDSYDEYVSAVNRL